MQQLTQQLKSGQMEIVEVPIPHLLPGTVMVSNFYSIISAGTEGKTVSDARKGYIAKARSRQNEVKQVIDLVRQQGIKSAYGMVMNKLEALSPLGYSCSGEVIAVAPDVLDFKPGDWVACGGSSAVHAEVVVVPKYLCAKIHPTTDLKEAAFTTISSIALQGIRQAELQLGAHATVIGLGLIGILTLKLLEASGIRCIGIDINTDAILRAQQFGFQAINRSLAGLQEQILNDTYGFGTDAVLITASTNSTDPINLAGEICRQKAKVIVVGAVPTGFERKNYYRKELDVRMSASYGPGRYDIDYEEKGRDYPIGYVRWTEQRNMQTISNLLKDRKLSFNDLISHTFTLIQAPEAYDLILEKKESHLGIVIEYDKKKKVAETLILTTPSVLKNTNVKAGFLGAGSFAQNILLPILKGKINFMGLATQTGNSAIYTGKKLGFSYITTNPDQVINDNQINTLFILTRHNLHAEQTISALKAGKHVFVEKPIALTHDELDKIKTTYAVLTEPKPLLMTGFNRRFSPAVQLVKSKINSNTPSAINIRVNAGQLSAKHWVNDPEIGGGRILGEVCHFIDLAIYLTGSMVTELTAFEMSSSQNTTDTLSITLKFSTGSMASINYFSNGNKLVNKEFIEVFNGQQILQIFDFKRVEMAIGTKKIIKKYSNQDKGHQTEINEFINAVSNGKKSPIDFNEIIHSMRVTLLIQEALRETRIITL